MAVDPDAAEVQPSRHPHRRARIRSPYRRRERVLRIVGEGDRLVFVAELLDGDHRSEDLGGDQLIALTYVGDHGWLVEVAAIADLVAAGHHPGMIRGTVH